MSNLAARTVPDLIELAKGGEVIVSQEARLTLAQFSDGVDALIKMHAEAKVPVIRTSLLNALASSAFPEKVIPVIKVGLRDTDPRVRYDSAYALAYMGKTAWPLLEESLRTFKDDGVIREAILYSMVTTSFRSPTAIPDILTYLRDKSPGVRRHACVLLGYPGADARDALPALRELLNDTDVDVRGQARYAIERIEGKP
jgi:HEAT repeat protein